MTAEFNWYAGVWTFGVWQASFWLGTFKERRRWEKLAKDAVTKELEDPKPHGPQLRASTTRSMVEEDRLRAAQVDFSVMGLARRVPWSEKRRELEEKYRSRRRAIEEWEQ